MAKTRRRHLRWGRVLKSFFLMVVFALVAWVVISYFNIVVHNVEENPTYFSWNFFNCIF